VECAHLVRALDLAAFAFMAKGIFWKSRIAWICGGPKIFTLFFGLFRPFLIFWLVDVGFRSLTLLLIFNFLSDAMLISKNIF
jgi:hypothetical protein